MATTEGFEIRLADTTEEFDRLRTAWQELERASGHINISASYEWLRTWWGVFESKRSWQFGRRKTLRILVLSRDGRLVAVAPLVRVERRRLWTTTISIEFLGQQWGATMLDFVSTEPSPAVTRAVLAWLQANESFDVLALSYIPETSPCFDLSEPAATLFAACPIVRRRDHGGYEEYSRALHSRNFRNNLRKTRNRIRAHGIAVDFRAQEPDAAAFVEMRRLSLCKLEDRKGSPFLDPEKERFLHEIYRKLPTEVLFLQFDGRPVAYRTQLTFGGGWFALDTSFDRAHRDLSPGRLLNTEALRRFFCETPLDFLCEGTGLGRHKRDNFAQVVRLYAVTLPGNRRRAAARAARALADARSVAERFGPELAAWLERT